MIEEQAEQLVEAINQAREEEGKNWSIKQMESRKKKLLEKIEELNNEEIKDDVMYFEETGVDALFVDEAHLFKNFYKNEQCCGPGFQRFPEGYGYAYEDTVYQRKKSGKGRHYGNGNPSVEFYGGTLCDAVISAGKAASRKGDLPF